MNPAPFTGDVLRKIIKDARVYPAEAIARDLGWELPRLARIVRDHRIDLRVPEVDAPSLSVAPGASVIPEDVEDYQPRRVREKRYNPYTTIKITRDVQYAVDAQAGKRALAASVVFGRAIAFVLKDTAAREAALAAAEIATGRRRTAMDSARLVEADRDCLIAITKAEDRTISWVVNALVEYVIEHDLWDQVLSGEGK